MILEELRKSGVQQAHSEKRRAGIYIGPEFGTVSRADLVDAAGGGGTPESPARACARA